MLQSPAICGVSDDVAHVSRMSRSPVKPPGTSRCSAVKPGGRSVEGSTGRASSDGRQHLVGQDLAVGVEPVPDRHRHPEEALAADQPVAVEAAHPVLVAVAHVARVPLQLLAAGDHLVAHGRVPAAVADVPLAAGDDLERLVALLEELHRARDGTDVADELAGLGEHARRSAPWRCAPSRRRAPRSAAGRLGRGDPLGRLAQQPAVAVDHRAVGQVELAPPLDVGEVAERAAHRDAGAAVHLGGRVREHRDLDVEQRRAHRRAEQRLVALVVGVRDERDAGRDQLGARGLDEDVVRRRPW